ncbi:MAG TPA: hypothetical protein VLG37_03180 [Candidatus Saccharimonadales bacterium]|nr:hypothetical protein [Candidatus Saccharimonadales bacterium]
MKYLKNPKIIWVLALLAVDVLFFLNTDPFKIASPLIIVGFLLLSLNIYWFFRALISLLALYIAPLKRHQARPARILTITASLLIAMQTIGQLSLKDVLALLPIVLIGYIYLSFNKKQRI